MNGHGRIEIQDFEPKTYLFSLGFECFHESSLDCFQYNVTIYDESNTTRCVDLNMTSKYSDMSQQSLTDQCKASYRYAAIPNQVGDTELYEAISTIKKFLRRNSSEVFLATPRCLTKLRPFVCEIVLPKCLPEENRILLPCRDDCNSVVTDCSANTQFNCDYLPPCEGRNTVSGIITDTDNTKWFLSNLSVRPAMTASIQYHIRFEIEEFVDPRPILTFYYNGQDSPNFSDKYNNEMYGQLFNEKLAIRLGRSGHSENHCRNSAGLFWEHWDCYGRIAIQDFEPKSYSFSIGCEESDEECDYDWNDDWKGWNNLYYEVTIYDESNRTKCLDLNMTRKYSDMSQHNLTDHCEVSYQYAAIPNQFGDTDLDGALSRINEFLRVNLSNVPSKLCLKKLKQIVCMIVLPKCLPEENKIILPCREDCKFYLEGCLAKVINCDYLPPCEGRNSVSGIITDNTTWFLSNLSVVPAKTASIVYNIRYPNDGPVPVLTFYYNGQDSPNLQQRCNAEMHGQLFNKDLAVPLLQGICREKFWCNYKHRGGWIRDCYGRTEIQDFEAKSYFFSLGFQCNETDGDLKGLHYEVTIYDESNETSCVDLSLTSEYSNMTQKKLIDQCRSSYQYAAIPNQFGDTDLDGAISRINEFLRVNHSDVPSKDCLKNLKPFLCEIVLPKCLPEENKIILPCRDDCKFYLEGCLGKDMNCDYLPPCEERNSVSGIITDNTTWFLSNLSVRPAMTASIEYHIRYQCPWYVYEILENPPVITFYYMGQDSPNLQRGCNSEMHGQLFNKDLAVPLNGKHREKFLCNRKGGMKVCHGRTKIQDFEPKSYFFSLGFECNERKGNLKGLKYEVTIYDESNETSCVDLNSTSEFLTDHCDKSYRYAAIPNQFGDTHLDRAISTMNKFLRVFHSDVPSKQCLKNLKPFLCEIVLPKCLPEENKILLPCRQDCKFYLQGCSHEVIGTVFVNCDYLPPCEGRNSVSGIFTDNTTWFLSNLSVRPAMTTSIQYNIRFQIEDAWNPPPIITFYYNGQNSPNLRHKCSSEMYGQLFNKDLGVPLYDRYRKKFWCNHKKRRDLGLSWKNRDPGL